MEPLRGMRLSQLAKNENTEEEEYEAVTVFLTLICFSTVTHYQDEAVGYTGFGLAHCLVS